MKPTGASASTFFVSVLRPMRCCSRAKGATRSSFQTTISPSSTVPFGSPAAAATISGKRSVTSSSPRDQIQTCDARFTTCARMPSYFHSTIQSSGAASRVANSSSGASSGWARKKGYGWPRSSGPASALAVSCR